VLAMLGFALRSAPAQTQTVDQVVAAIGNFAITHSDVVREYRIETFEAEGRVPSVPPDAPAFPAVRTRLIDQKLLEQQLPNYPAPSAEFRKKAMDQMHSIRGKCKSEAGYLEALRSLGLTEAGFLGRLEQQQHILMMIDERLRPAATVTSREIDEYYHQTFLPEFARSVHGAPPPLSEVDDKIRGILVEKKINQMLAEWLAELRRSAHVRTF
jgi:peptidyl-prolyl cis-trans isomerase SurA